MDRTAAMVNEYTSTAIELAPLKNSEYLVQSMDQRVADISSELKHRQSLLQKSQQEDAQLQKRIHRNANPRFLHYFVCNREAKVERLKCEQNQLVVFAQDLLLKITDDSSQLSQLTQQQQKAHSAVDRKHVLESSCHSLFEKIVDAQQPTQVLLQYRASLQEHRGQLVAEQDLRKAIDRSVHELQQGLELFRKAEDLYRQALETNERAKNIANREIEVEKRQFREAVSGDDLMERSHDRRRLELEQQERVLQARSDALINRAHDVAMCAYAMVSRAFAQFPTEAMTRYPELCEYIPDFAGQVDFARVEGVNFKCYLLDDAVFGNMGTEIESNAGCKIRQNVHIAAKCAGMTLQQQELIAEVLGVVNANVQHLTANIQGLEQKIRTERANIFNSVRASMVQQAVAAQAA